MASAYNSYNAIVSAVQEVAEDTGTEFVAFIPKSIEAAQLRLQKEIDLEGLRTNTSVAVSASDRLVSKPTGYRFMHTAFLFDSSSGTETLLKFAKPDFARDYWPVATSTGVPSYIAPNYSETEMLLAPTPDKNYTIRMGVQADEATLSASNQTNFYTDKCGEALFYGTMVEQSRFMKAWDQMQFWEQSYLNAVQGLNNQGRRQRQQDGEQQENIEGSPNTLLGTV